MTERIILKILTATQWTDAQSGALVQAPLDIADGFVHFSTASQVQETLDKWFQGEEGAVLLAFDTQDFADTLKWEPSRNDELFPHVYGPVKAEQVKAHWAMQMGQGGAPLAPREALEFSLK